MRLVLAVFALVGLCSARWKCSRRQIARASGNICCNSGVGGRMKKQMLAGPTKAAAVEIRRSLEAAEGGFWEVVVSKSDFGFANYMVSSYHCKVAAAGRTALAWKVLGGGLAKRARKAKKDSSAEDDIATTLLPTTSSQPKTTTTTPTATSQATTKNSAGETTTTTTKSPSTTTAKRRSGASSRKTPNEKLMECCLAEKVAPSCYNKAGGKANICDFNEYKTQSLVDHYLQKTCPPEDMGKILLCASSHTGHNDCCAGNGVEIPLCSVFCNAAAGLRAPKPEEFKCANYLSQIKSCFIRYMKYGQSYGRDA